MEDTTEKEIKDYFKEKECIVEVDEGFDGGLYYIARYKDVEGLIGTGDTEKEAIEDLKEVQNDWYILCKELGRI